MGFSATPSRRVSGKISRACCLEERRDTRARARPRPSSRQRKISLWWAKWRSRDISNVIVIDIVLRAMYKNCPTKFPPAIMPPCQTNAKIARTPTQTLQGMLKGWSWCAPPVKTGGVGDERGEEPFVLLLKTVSHVDDGARSVEGVGDWSRVRADVVALASLLGLLVGTAALLEVWRKLVIVQAVAVGFCPEGVVAETTGGYGAVPLTAGFGRWRAGHAGALGVHAERPGFPPHGLPPLIS